MVYKKNRITIAINLTAFALNYAVPIHVLASSFTTKNQTLNSIETLPKQRLNGKIPTVARQICPAQLSTEIASIINRPKFRRARWGILVEPLSAKTQNYPLYSLNADRYFIPASNTKLLTTAAALLALGSDYRIQTSVYDAGKGRLRVVGRGDPSLTETQLKDLAQQLKSRGIQQIKKLIVEDDYFHGDIVPPTWEWEDIQADYGASVNSLILHQNAVEITLLPQKIGQQLRLKWSDDLASKQWRIENHSVTTEARTPNTVSVAEVLGQPILRITGQLAIDAEPDKFGLAILNPAQYFLQYFRQILTEKGIKVEQVAVTKLNKNEINKNNDRELAAVASPPLSALIFETNQESNNLYAEVLLRTLQVLNHTSSNHNSVDVGLQQLKATLTQLGVDPQSYVLVDGSGLSRHNLVSPEAIAQTLQLMAKTPQAQVYQASLPVAGVSGSLKNRFLHTIAQGHIRAKTGGMTGVSTLSGYLDIPGYQPVVFSIIVNQSDQSFATLRQAIDEIVLLMSRLHSC